VHSLESAHATLGNVVQTLNEPLALPLVSDVFWQSWLAAHCVLSLQGAAQNPPRHTRLAQFESTVHATPVESPPV